MRDLFNLRRVRRWPRWFIIPVGIILAALAVVLGLLIEPAADALSPGEVEPTPTLLAVHYSRTLSDGCHDCHVSLPALRASAEDPSAAETVLIEPESVMTAHGTLGCVACHAGNGEAEDKETGHEGLIVDISRDEPEQCIICHADLPVEIPGDRLRVPHEIVSDWIVHGEPGILFCSDCHGGVGHGFDPVSGEVACSMTVCLDCHEAWNLEVQMTDCDACHIGPHDVAASLTCNDCHSSTLVWHEIDLGIHPVPLEGQHGEVSCFGCHQYPNFKGLNNVCADCHLSGHPGWGEGDCAECHDPGGTWSFSGEVWPGHVERWDQYKGAHLDVSCAGCHFDGYEGTESSCDACHMRPEEHDSDAFDNCVQCHQADQPWPGS